MPWAICFASGAACKIMESMIFIDYLIRQWRNTRLQLSTLNSFRSDQVILVLVSFLLSLINDLALTSSMYPCCDFWCSRASFERDALDIDVLDMLMFLTFMFLTLCFNFRPLLNYFNKTMEKHNVVAINKCNPILLL